MSDFKQQVEEIEFGCGGKMADGLPCTSLGSAPCLCGECIQLLPTKFLSAHNAELDRIAEGMPTPVMKVDRKIKYWIMRARSFAMGMDFQKSSDQAYIQAQKGS